MDHSDEGGALEAGLELTGCDDSHGEGGVVLQLEATMEGREKPGNPSSLTT